MNELGVVLKQLREMRNLTIEQLANRAGIGRGTVGDIETGRSKARISTLEKLSIALNLTEKERDFLFSKFMPKDIGDKLTKIEKVQFNDILNSVSAYYNDLSIDEEDKKKLRDRLLDLFYDSKNKNRRK